MVERISAAHPGPREVFELLHERVRDDYDMDGQADLYAQDGVLELPFALPSMPRRLRGREEIRGFLREAGRTARRAGRRIMRYDPVVVHETADPEVIVAEFDLHGEVAGTGETYRLSFIQVLRIREGKIVSMRDYFDPPGYVRLMRDYPPSPPRIDSGRTCWKPQRGESHGDRDRSQARSFGL